jgi:hypothetical protein
VYRCELLNSDSLRFRFRVVVFQLLVFFGAAVGGVPAARLCALQIFSVFHEGRSYEANNRDMAGSCVSLHQKEKRMS